MLGSKDDYKRKPPLKSEHRITKGKATWHDYVLSGISPEDEQRVLMQTRERARQKYGWSDEDLDKAYGPLKK